mgnify:FL=1
MTESTAVGAHTATLEEKQKLGSTGRIAPNTEFKIVNIESGTPMPPNEKGEIWMRGPTIMKGLSSYDGLLHLLGCYSGVCEQRCNLPTLVVESIWLEIVLWGGSL